jgi:hypothetical protein
MDEYLEESRAAETLAIVIAFPILAFLTVLARLYTRLVTTKIASTEDLLLYLH